MLVFALTLLPLAVWGLYTLATMPYRPPKDMNSLLGAGEMLLVLVLIGILSILWLSALGALIWSFVRKGL